MRTGPHSPRSIADGTGLKRGTVRKELSRLRNDGAVVQEQAGYWRAFMDASELAQFKAPLPAVHHVQIQVSMPQNGVTLPPAPGGRQARLDGLEDASRTAGWRPVEENGGWHRETWFEGRKLTLSLYPDARLVNVFLRASEAPLDGPTWGRYLAFLRGTFLGWGIDLEAAQARVVQFDINVDVHGLRIEGATAISLRRFSDAYLRAYNKADRLRFEVAVAHPMRVDELTGIMEQFYERARRRPDEDDDSAPGAGGLPVVPPAPATAPAAWGMEVV